MTALANWKISAKIMAVVAMMGLIAGAMSILGERTTQKLVHEYDLIVEHTQAGALHLVQVRQMATAMMYQAYRELEYDAGSEEAKGAAERFERAATRVHERLALTRDETPETAQELDVVAAELASIEKLARASIKLAEQDRKLEARRILFQADAHMTKLLDLLEAGTTRRLAQVAKTTEAAKADSRSSTRFEMLVGVLGVLAGLAASWSIARFGITGPLDHLRNRMEELASGNNQVDVPGTDRRDEVGAMAKTVLVFRDTAIKQAQAQEAKRVADEELARVVQTVGASLERIADGDLTAEVKADFPPAYAALRSNLNGAVASLRNLVGAVVVSAENIKSGSTEIADASEDLARRTESNAANLEETTAAIQQMEIRIRATADAASSTVQRANTTIETVSSGRMVTEEAVQAMGRVSESAKGIDSVIEGLDKIAFQTRVLAMNAAVEAGRAGEAGRGFAVVADLVSALAMRAEEEAKRARDQLTVTQSEVGSAVEAVERVDNALGRIVSDVDAVHQLLDGMASDNQAQAAAITEISTAVNMMDRSTQQNAAMVEEASAASRNLMTESATLARMTQQFKVVDTGMPPHLAAQVASGGAQASLH